MLERAPSCLESSGRQLLRAPKPCTKTRRMLHSSFWHHGASDLSLPIWWASVVPSLIPTDRSYDGAIHRDPKRYIERRKGQSDFILEFLYPAKTMALIQNISNYGWDTWDTRRKRQLGGNGVRQFSSKTRKLQQQSGKMSTANSKMQDDGNSEHVAHSLDPLASLRRLFSLQEERNEELAWRLYQDVREYDRDSSLRADLLDYLSSSDRSIDPNKLLRLFDTLLPGHRRPSSYRAAISAYLHLQVVGQAVKLHEEAADQAVRGNFGTDLVLARTIQDNQWDLTLQVYGTLLRFWDRESVSKDEEHYQQLWTALSRLPNLPSHAIALLRYAQQFEHDIRITKDRQITLRAFVADLVPKVINSVVEATDIDDDFIFEFLQTLRALGLAKPLYYECAIEKMLSMPKYRNYNNQRKTLLQLYSTYKQDGSPSRAVIWSLLKQVGYHESFDDRTGWKTTVSTLVDDWRKFHGRLATYQLYRLMILHSRAGYADKVHEFFDELRAQSDEPMQQKYLTQLLYVYARQMNVAATSNQFRRISEEFGLTPDIHSWSALVYAYVRADDLDGAMQCFHSLLESGLIPQEDTFAHVLNLCARRGDVEYVKSLFSKADSLKVPIQHHTETRLSLVLANVNNDDMKSAETVAEQMAKDHAAGDLHGPMTPTWNVLITHYALRQDIASSMRAYRRMRELQIPLDTWTYAALMRSLIQIRQTNAAYKILRVTMPNNNVRVHGFHYALVISGFIAETQIHRALHAADRMVKRNIRPTISTRIALLKVKALVKLRELKTDSIENTRTRSMHIDQELRDILLASNPSDLAVSQPRTPEYSTPLNQLAPEAYFEFLIRLYGKEGTYGACKEMFDTAIADKRDQERHYEAPVELLTALMQVHYNAEEHGEVEKCWNLARAHAEKLTKKMSTSSTTRPSTLYKPAPATKIARNRSAILIRATRIYVRSLLRQKDRNQVEKLRKTVFQLLTDGYLIDNLVWNKFIQLLVRMGLVIDAFTACESYLMPGFVGWKRQSSRRKNIKFYDYMDVRPADLRSHTPLPRYSTLITLAAAYAHVKKGDGIRRWDRAVDEESRVEGVLRQVAPKTIRAIESMPVLPDDKLQKKYLTGV